MRRVQVRRPRQNLNLRASRDCVQLDLGTYVGPLALVPLAVGLLWLAELMPRLGIDLNLANFFALPILIGAGVDGGVHMVHRYRESRDVGEVVRTTGSTVTLSFLTTMVGFGALANASHQGVASLGHLMLFGMLTILAATVLLLPAVLRMLKAPTS